MANKMSPGAEKQLAKDVSKILKLAARKKGATGEDICKALGIEPNFMAYRYRRAIGEAKDGGIYLCGAGRTSVWRFAKKRSRK